MQSPESAGPISDIPQRKRNRARRALWIAISLALVAAIASVGFFLSVRAVRVPTGGMLDTYQIGDVLLVNKLAYMVGDPKFGDVLIFHPPAHALHPGHGQVQFIQRCVGVPGDTIEIKNGVFLRNGKKVDEPYVSNFDPMGSAISDEDAKQYFRDFKLVLFEGEYWPLTIYEGTPNAEFGRTAEEFMLSDPDQMKKLMALPAAKIPPGHYLTMGDNRLNSFDGRGWGLVPRKNILGKAGAIIGRD